MKMSLGFKKTFVFTPQTQVITAPPNSWASVAVPAGASSVRIRGIGAGGAGSNSGKGYSSYVGGGGAYSELLALSLAGISTLAYFIPGWGLNLDTEVRIGSSTGTLVMRADSGSSAVSGSGNGPPGQAANCIGTTAASGSGRASNGPNGLGVAPAGVTGGYGYGGPNAASPGGQGWLEFYFT